MFPFDEVIMINAKDFEGNKKNERITILLSWIYSIVIEFILEKELFFYKYITDFNGYINILSVQPSTVLWKPRTF